MNLSLVKTKVFLFLSIMLSLIFLVSGINAQSGTSNIRGTITDQNGGAVPGATVRLINPDTGFNRNTTTNEEGAYSFPTVAPGTYQIEVEAQNFKKTIKSDVRALVDTTVEASVQLEPGEVSAVVNVTTGTIDSQINTQDASLGNNFVPQQITQLPTDSRNIPDLLSLQPGVTREGYVAGGRSDQANITLDGIDVNDQQTGAAFTSVLRITAESVEEFRITTTNANANQGRSSGAQVSIITKGGTNDFRGALFLFHRPDKFSANNFFNNRAGVYGPNDSAVILGTAQVGDEKAPRPNLKRTIFGGALGGPIIKDKAFFFYSYEGFRERQSVPVVRIVPLASMGRGELRFIGRLDGEPTTANRVITLTTAQLNGIYPVVGINPAAVAVFANAAMKYPANDLNFGDGLNTGGFRFNAPAPVDLNTHALRLDWNLKSNQTLAFRGNYQQDSSQLASYFPDTTSPELWSHPWGFGVSHNWTLSNNKVNNFRYGITRQAFTQGGDATENAIIFRFVFQPKAFSYAFSRITSIQNFTDDFTWIAGNHTFQFGGNVRIIRNNRVTLGSSFDNAVANPSFYDFSGAVLDEPVEDSPWTIGAGQTSVVQNAAASLIGRFSQYTGTFNYDINGNTLPVGTPIERNFATEEYDAYIQDSWKPFRNLTLTLGLRYGLSRPVYERNGFQVVPDRPLGEFFEDRVASAANGTPFNELIQFELAGPKNNGPGFYKLDKNNFQPRIAVAWSPNFKNKFLKALFGSEDKSVIRGGFAITNDYFGQQLAVTFDALTTVGFTTSDTIAANTYDVTTNPAPRFMGFGQSIRTLPGISAPNRFMVPADEDARIESSLDSTLVSPVHYTWNLTYGRQLPKGLYLEVSYIGRKARNLLVERDIMALNNLVDRTSGMDWYTAANMLYDLRNNNTPITSVPNIPYFQNLFPGVGGVYTGNVNLTSTQEFYAIVAREFVNNDENQGVIGGFNIPDWTFLQLLFDDLGTSRNLFFHPQYAAFSAYSTVGKLDYHGGTLSIRQRLGTTLSYDINYTFSKSFDNASGLQNSGGYGAAFVLNPLRPEDNRSVSDYDVRHIVNANFIFQLPFGKGRQWFSGINSVTNTFIGGWQLSGVFRWNTGLPIQSPIDAAIWATNWNVQSAGVRTRPVTAQVDRTTANMFRDPVQAYNSYRNARPGETGDRNVLRGPGFSVLDLGLSKTFNLPWGDNQKLQFRWEVFNVTNVQYFQVTNLTRGTIGLDIDPQLGTPSSEFGQVYTDIQGQPRRMQFGLRYSF